MAPGVVVGGVFLPRDELLGVEELPVGPSSDLIDYGGLQVDEDSPGDVFASSSLELVIIKVVSWSLLVSYNQVDVEIPQRRRC